MTAARSSRFDAAIIGAGHNGLTTAAMLAKAGRRVLVLERREIVGGLAVGDEFHPGFRSVGPLRDGGTVQPAVIDALRLAQFGFAALPDAAPVFLPQRDGAGLLLHRDGARSADEIAAISKADAESYVRFREFLDNARGFGGGIFGDQPTDFMAGDVGALMKLLSSGLSLRRLGRKGMNELLRIGPTCVADWLNEWFETDLLKCALSVPAAAGSFTGPHSPGTTGSLLRWDALAGKAVRGGGAALIAALDAAARSYGAEIRTESEVKAIRVESGRTLGVLLHNDEEIATTCVIASCNPKTTLLDLLGPRDVAQSFEQHVRNYRTNGVTAQVNLALSGPLRFACRPELQVERAIVGKSLRDFERAFDAVKYRRFSPRPILEIDVPSVADVGSSVASILVHYAPYDLDGGWSDGRRRELGDSVINVLKDYVPDIESSVVAREVLTPVDIESRYGVTGGHLYHGDHTLDQLFVRPCPECARYDSPIAGLYLCGSGSHPGGGLTCMPGFLAAKRVLSHKGG